MILQKKPRKQENFIAFFGQKQLILDLFSIIGQKHCFFNFF